MIGTVLDKYLIEEKIGEGGMASVYRGRHLTLGRDVAIKILHPHLSNGDRNERNRMRFAREARAIENLHHDNILRIFDYSGEDTQDCYIVTEFVDGQTLQQLLSDHGALPSEVVALVGLALADALEYAHGLGIIHRDLKPENVMLRRDGTVKLMDFGIARFLDEMHLTVTGALVGSPAYMSPEQAMEKVLDSRSDLFSLGTLLFHLVTGQLPFSGNNPSIVLRNIIEGNRPGVADLAPDVSGPLGDLVHALLQTDPNDRPRSAAVVRVRLVEALAEVELRPDDPDWTLQSWLIDPKGYKERLDLWLREVLLRKGKACLEARDHLAALQLFNRLLSIDEDNAEVLAMVQGMHGSHEERRRAWQPWAAGLGLLCVAGLVTWALWPELPGAAGDLTSGRRSATAHSTAALTPVAESAPLSPTAGTGNEAQELEPPSSDPGAPAPDDGADATARKERLPDAPPRQPTLPPEGGSTRPPAALPLVGRPPPAALAAAQQGETIGAAPEPGMLTVSVPGAWADVYIDAELKGRLGSRRDPIQVNPGTHTLTVRNTHARDHEEQFTIAPGERLHITIPALERKPVLILVQDEVDPDCSVRVDGQAAGTVGSLSRMVTISSPDQPHLVELVCTSGTTRRVVGPVLPGETVRIP